MPNTYFQFKQFRIEQGKCAMKISTDACILGAYTAQNIATNSQNILDIGTGTGLLSLMLAQAKEAQITAIEIEDNAYQQAKANFEASSWSNRLQVFHQAIQAFALQQSEIRAFDLLICNPPFFVNSLKSPQKEKSLARHTDSLPFGELLACADRLANENAKFVVLLPLVESLLFEKELNKTNYQFVITEKLLVQDKPNKQPHRVILTLGRKEEVFLEKILIVKDIIGNYTADFIRLLKEYYLYL